MKKIFFKHTKNLFVFLLIFAVLTVTINFASTSFVYAGIPTTNISYSALTNHGGTVIVDSNNIQTDDQWITLTVNFNDKISITTSEAVINELTIKLNGNNTITSIPTGTYPSTKYATVALGSDQKSLVFTIHFGYAAMAGLLTVQSLNGITSITNAETGTPIAWSPISLLVSNGVQLQTVSQIEGNPDENVQASVTKKVIAPASCTRGMVHMILLKNGVPVGTLNSYGANVTSHYHTYFTLNANSFASTISGSFSSFSSDYAATYNGTSVTNADSSITYTGDTVTITAKNSSKGDVLDLRTYTYPQTIQSDLNKDALSAAINKASTLDTSKFTTESVKNLNNEMPIASSMNASVYYLQSELDNETQLLTTMINNLEYKTINSQDTSTGISIIGSANVLPLDTSLSVTKISNTDTLNAIKKSLKVVDNSVGQFSLFDIALLSNNVEIEPNGNVTVSVPIPDGYDSKNLAVYHIDDNGNITKINFTIENSKIIFTTSSFSYYAIAQITETAIVNNSQPTSTIQLTPTKTGDSQSIYLYALLCTITLAGTITIFKRQNNNING